MSAVVDVRQIDAESARDADLWRGYIGERAATTFFHQLGWKRAIERAFGHACPYLLATRAGRPVGVLPLTLVRSRLFGRRLVSTGFAVRAGPIADDATVEAGLLAEARKLADAAGVGCIEVRAALPERHDRVTRTGFYANFSKRIEPDDDANLKAIPRKQRAMVRKGINAGLTSRADHDVDTCHGIYASSVRNLGTPVFPKAWFRALVAAFPAESEVTTVLAPDGQPVAAVLSFFFRDTVLPYYGGGLASARRLAANDVMYWEVMRRAAARGYTEFDFGRSKVDSGAYAFKKNWGFPPEPLAYSYELVRATAPPDLSPTNPKFATATRLWQRLPLAVTNTVGPWIARDLA